MSALIGRRVRGAVLSYDVGSGYGFARVPGLGRDVFLHVSDTINHEILNPGDIVEFFLVRERKGYAGRRVRVVETERRS